MDSRKIIILEDTTANALMLIHHCIVKYGIDSFSWLNLGGELVQLKSIQEQDIYKRIKEKCKGDFLFDNNYFSTVNVHAALEELNKIKEGNFLFFYDLQLGKSDHTEISKKLGELVSKSKNQKDLCVFILIYSSAFSRTYHMQLIDITNTYVRPSSHDFGVINNHNRMNEIAEMIVNEGTEGFEIICKTEIEKKIWPEYTKNWFDDDFNGQKVPHDFNLINGTKRKETCKNEIKRYFNDLLSPIKTPESWFTENQFCYLYNDLKGLIGSCSAFQGCHENEAYPKHRITLGNLVLLLALMDKVNCPKWIVSISWDRANSERSILPKQNYNQAVEVIDSIINENKGIRKLIFDKSNGSPLIDQVIFQGNRLKVVLKLPFNDRLKEKVLTLTSTEKGGTYNFYRNFLITSGKTDYGRKAECAINLFSEDNQTVLEVISCA